MCDSGDGEEIVGSAYIYRRIETTWMEEARLTPPNASANADWFGLSASVKGDIIVFGDHMYDGYSERGAVFVYEYSSLLNSWNQIGGTLMNNNCEAHFGYFVRLTQDAELLVSCGNEGAVSYYEKQETGDRYELQVSIA